MATMAIGYRHNPKPRGNSAPSPFTNWAKGTLVNNNDGFVKQTKKYIFKGCTDSATYIKWGDKNLSWNMDSNGKSGHMYVPDEKYNSSDSSHNVLWAVKWAPYSMSAAGISFDFVQSTSSTGWGFGRMFLFYKHSSSGSIIARKLSPISGCKTGDNADFRFHDQDTTTYSGISNLQDHSYGTRAHLIANCSDPGPAYMCIGWGGFFTVTKQSNVTRDHGFRFNNFYLLPSGNISTSDRWIGGMCHSSNAPSGRYILTQ
jgi:hypothetical protein